MPTFKKRVIGPGVYQTPDGPAQVTPARIKHWHDTLTGMLAAGYKPPVAWGHHSQARPATDDDRQFWAAKFNAGKVVGSEIDRVTGELVIRGDAPGIEVDRETGALVTEAELPDGRKVRTAIEEVSIGCLDWTDGHGKVWKDAPVHLALTPLPVWVPEGGQPPFELSEPPGQHFGTGSTLLYHFLVESPEPRVQSQSQSQRPALGSRLSALRFAATVPPMTDDAAPQTDRVAEDPAPAETANEPIVNFEGAGEDLETPELVQLLAEAGVQLPEDTTKDNFCERLLIALKVLKGQKQPPQEAAETPPAPEAPEAPVTEENPGAFMSTLADTNPFVRALIADRDESDREKRLARIDAFVKRGLRPAVARFLREEASKVRFAVGADGRPARAAVDGYLDLLEKQLPEGSFEATYLSTLMAGAAEEEAPEEQRNGRAHCARIADEQARNSRLPAREKK